MMTETSKWIEAVKSTFIFGEDDENSETADCEEQFMDSAISSSALHKIEHAINTYLLRANDEGRKDELLVQSLQHIHADLEKEKHILDPTAVILMTQKYLKLQLKIRHLSLIKAMYKLRNFQSVQDIPNLIFGIIDDVPEVLLAHSRIKQVVLDTVKDIKVGLLAHFHGLFEDHLAATQREPNNSADGNNSSTSSSSGTSKNAASSSTSLWVIFLAQARDYLLAYALVNMLPTVLTETKAMILEKFQDTLDEALTPIWGRYHYHLQVHFFKFKYNSNRIC